MWQQQELRLAPRSRGFHLITGEVVEGVSGLAEVSIGLLHLQLLHTSASLTLNENADPDVRRDLDAFFRRLVPPSDDPSMRWVVHTAEGPDDMPAHIKAALTAVSLSIPVTKGRLALGTWQGIYLFEHRDRPHRREIVLHLGP